jgi:Ni,Fe-hydrogenase maturation factor
MTGRKPCTPSKRDADHQSGWGACGNAGDGDGQRCESTTLLVGIGSGHGDDSIGWRVAQAIGSRWPGRFRVEIPSTPIGLVDRLEGVERLFVCDAFVCAVDGDDSTREDMRTYGGRWGSVRRWRWPDAAIDQTPFCGTHDFPLAAVLRLVESIGKLPAEVHVIGIDIGTGEGQGQCQGASDMVDASRGCEWSPKLAGAFDQIVDRVMAEIADA